MTKDWFMDYAEHALRVIELEQEWLEIRYLHLYGEEFRGRHDVQWTKDEHGRFTGSVSSGGGSAGGGKSVDNVVENDIIKSRGMYRKKDSGDAEYHYISRNKIDQLTIEARKNGAEIIIDDPWFNARMEKENASAVTYGDIIVFGKNVTISDVLEETHHFMQNKAKLNDDKPHDIREILNEIDAKQYLLKNAKKYKIPRNETELTRKQLESYKQRLKEISGETEEYV